MAYLPYYILPIAFLFYCMHTVSNVFFLDFSDKGSPVGVISLLLRAKPIANGFLNLEMNTIMDGFIEIGSAFNNVLEKLNCFIVSLSLLLLVPLLILFFMLLLDLFFVIYFAVIIVTV
jgi:hypothetical protein